jgi:hypothetical protein
MQTKFLAIVSFMLLLISPCEAPAAPLKTFVSEFSVAGVPGNDELKATLQRLLAARLDHGQARLVESAEKAELVLTGGYALFGKTFTLDVLLKQRESGAMTMVFEQGDGADELIPAVGRLAQKVDHELAKLALGSAATPAGSGPSTPASSVSSPPAGSGPSLPAHGATKTAAPLLAVRNEAAVATASTGYLVRPGSEVSGNWNSDALEGVFTGLALGRTLASGERELFLASEQSIRMLRKGTALQQVDEVVIPVPARVLALDSADLDRDGVPELYVTVMDRENLSSRVYQPAQAGLVLLAENQPWFFRGSGDTGNRTILAQKMDTKGGFYGGVAELVKTGNRFETRNSSSPPGGGNLFNSTRFLDKTGAETVALLKDGGRLAVYSPAGEEIWQSSDKYGGSETYYEHRSDAPVRAMGEEQQRHYLEQRITPLPDGVLLVPQNDASSFLGSSRSYDKYSIKALHWTGSRLQEIWHTQQVPGYLADYAYDPVSRELFLLEVLQRGGLLSKGKSVISVNRIE